MAPPKKTSSAAPAKAAATRPVKPSFKVPAKKRIPKKGEDAPATAPGADGAEPGEKAKKPKKDKKKLANESYRIYVYKVMKDMHPELSISSEAMSVLNDFVKDMFSRLARKSSENAKDCGKNTMSAHEVKAATLMLLTGQLGQHAACEGAKAVEKFSSSTRAPGSKVTSKSKTAGLQFPVGRISRYLHGGEYTSRVGATAPVYMAAVIEYLVAELVEIAGNAASCNGSKRITPRHIQMARCGDEELRKLLSGIAIGQAGVMINPHVMYPSQD